MVFRTWAKLSGITVGVAALAATGQLGLAYGLGILRLTRVVDVTQRDLWFAQLAWVSWIAMTAAAVGGIAAHSRLPRPAGPATRMALAILAGVGAAIVVPLTMQPARTAQVAGVRPSFVIGVCAVLGAAAGIFAAYAAVSRAVARWSLAATGIAVWAVAVISMVPALASGEPAGVRLGVFDASFLDSSVTRRTALFTMPLLALIAGGALGALARRRGMSTFTIAVAGLPGPALLTAAYLIAGPGNGPDRYEVVPYWAAMTAAGAGVLGSVLAAVLRSGPATDEPRTPAPDPGLPPLPQREAGHESAIARAASAAARRSPEQLRPSDTGTFMPPQARATPPRQARATPERASFDAFTLSPRSQPLAGTARPPHPTRPGDDDVVDWVSKLGN